MAVARRCSEGATGPEGRRSANQPLSLKSEPQRAVIAFKVFSRRGKDHPSKPSTNLLCKINSVALLVKAHGPVLAVVIVEAVQGEYGHENNKGRGTEQSERE